jgi:hypothetical protein
MVLQIGDWWVGLNNSEKIFWGISLVFSVLFVIQFVLNLIGVDFTSDSDGADAPEGYHLDAEFALFSVRSIIAFFTFFGWTGVFVLSREGSFIYAIVIALIAGFAAMLLVAWLFWMFARLGESGNVDIYQSLFTTGEVYVPIPGFRKGTGRILIELGGAIREMDALTEGDPIGTGTKVKVVEVMDRNILVVYPLETFDSQDLSEPPSLIS